MAFTTMRRDVRHGLAADDSKATVEPAEVLRLAYQALPIVTKRFPVADPSGLARTMVALVDQESTFRTCVSPGSTSALGLTQIINGTWRAIEKLMKWDAQSPDLRCVPWYSILYGEVYLAYCLQLKKGNMRLGLQAYNGGPSKAKYATSILAKYSHFDFTDLERTINAPSIYAQEWY